MKSAFLFLVFLVAASASFLTRSEDHRGVRRTKLADKQFLVRNGNLIRLFDNMLSNNIYKDQVEIGRSFILERHMDLYTDTDAIRHLIVLTKFGMLPKNKIFTLSNKRQKEEAVVLFKVLYTAKDFDTFYRTACWAREHINEGMFIYALTVAIIHRDDTRGMTLPAPYEIRPNLFFNTEVITKAQRLKMQGLIQDKNIAENLGIYQHDDTFLIKSKYSGWYTKTNKENALTYFTEDISLNTFFYYFQTTFPTWMSSDDGMITTRRGELFLYIMQQILARYYMERLSNDLGEIPRFFWKKEIKTGFKSSLKHVNGLDFPSRPNDFLIWTVENLQDITLITDFETRLRDAIDSGRFMTENGEFVSLKHPEDIEKLGNILQGTRDNMNPKYFKRVLGVAKKILGNGDKTIDDYKTNPTIMQTLETRLHDPVYFQIMKRFYNNVLMFKNYLRPYKREDVGFDGVTVRDIQVDKLVTFFDYEDTDITNCVPRKLDDIIHGEKLKTMRFKVVQKRLNHLPFKVKLDIDSDKTTETIVRIFLGPKYDSLHRKMKMDENRINFVNLDTFLYDLKTGRNTIIRESREFFATRGDIVPTREVLKKITKCIEGTEECIVNMDSHRTGFPESLMLPKGKEGGMDMQIYVIITPLHRTRTFGSEDVTGKKTEVRRNKHLDALSERLLYDDNALGFPLDRKIDETTFWHTNMLLRDVTIIHKTDIKLNQLDQELRDHTIMDFDHGTFHGMDRRDRV